MKFSKLRPKRNQFVDVWIKDKGRENDYLYEGSRFLYDNELDLTREIGEDAMKATHWMPIPQEPTE